MEKVDSIPKPLNKNRDEGSLRDKRKNRLTGAEIWVRLSSPVVVEEYHRLGSLSTFSLEYTHELFNLL